jgi:DNA-directed RNA polymerase III subunit RPC1
MYFIM